MVSSGNSKGTLPDIRKLFLVPVNVSFKIYWNYQAFPSYVCEVHPWGKKGCLSLPYLPRRVDSGDLAVSFNSNWEWQWLRKLISLGNKKQTKKDHPHKYKEGSNHIIISHAGIAFLRIVFRYDMSLLFLNIIAPAFLHGNIWSTWKTTVMIAIRNLRLKDQTALCFLARVCPFKLEFAFLAYERTTTTILFPQLPTLSTYLLFSPTCPKDDLSFSIHTPRCPKVHLTFRVQIDF